MLGIAVVVFGLVLIAQRRELARPYWLVCLAVMTLGAGARRSPSTIILLVWFIYWLRSRRVRDTFAAKK